jgi:hypothetical protein
VQGLSDEIMIENRRRDYEYALKMTAPEDLDLIEKTMKLKLSQRTHSGAFQIIRRHTRPGGRAGVVDRVVRPRDLQGRFS